MSALTRVASFTYKIPAAFKARVCARLNQEGVSLLSKTEIADISKHAGIDPKKLAAEAEKIPFFKTKALSKFLTAETHMAVRVNSHSGDVHAWTIHPFRFEERTYADLLKPHPSLRAASEAAMELLLAHPQLIGYRGALTSTTIIRYNPFQTREFYVLPHCDDKFWISVHAAIRSRNVFGTNTVYSRHYVPLDQTKGPTAMLLDQTRTLHDAKLNIRSLEDQTRMVFLTGIKAVSKEWPPKTWLRPSKSTELPSPNPAPQQPTPRPSRSVR